MEKLLEFLAGLVISVIEKSGYAGITFLMALESANIPVPSEVIMPFSGFLVSRGSLFLFSVIFFGTLGNLLGSLISYYFGVYGGRRFLERYGKFFFLHKNDLEKADKLFTKYGNAVVFFSRMLPIVRTFISFPAGVARMNVIKFSIYTFLGSFLWSGFLAYMGFQAGENWDLLQPYFRRFDWVIVALMVLGAIWWIRRYVREIKRQK